MSQITEYFVTSIVKNMESIAKTIEMKIVLMKSGTIFFLDTFSGIGSPDVVRQTLSRLCKEKKILRLAQGIYCKPIIDTKLGLGTIAPSVEQIAQAIASHDKARIVSTGVHALNKLGLSTQVPMNYLYYTDGFSRHIKLQNGTEIAFKAIAPKNFAFQNPMAMQITFALKSLKREEVTEEHIARIHTLLSNIPQAEIQADYVLMPQWIQTIIRRAYE